MPDLTASKLRGLLHLPDPVPATWSEDRIRRQDGVIIKELSLGPRRIPALCLEPECPPTSPRGILYCHAHGNAYGIGKSEVTQGRPALLDPLGLTLARAGATVLCPDLAGFGDRQKEGTESALAKAALWSGRPLIGQMVGDLFLALEVLNTLVPKTPVATVGISMGGTLAYLVAALREEVAACAQMCVFSDIGPLIGLQSHDLHGPYMTIPGLLPDHDLGEIAALVAPRPHLVITGAQDPLTPPEAYLPAAHTLTEAYKDTKDALWLHRDAEAGHHETPTSRHVLRRFLSEKFGLPA